MDDLKERAVSSVGWTSISSIVSILLRLLTLTLLARILTPDAFGLAAMVFALSGIAQLFAHMGLGEATIQKAQNTTEELSSVYWLNLSFAAIAFLSFWALTPLIVRIYQEPRVAPFVGWVAVSLLVAAVGQQFGAMLRKHLRFRDISKAEVSAGIIESAVSISVAAMLGDPRALVWGPLAGTAVRSILLMASAWGIWHPSFHFELQEVKPHLRFGLFHVGAMAANEVNVRVPQVLVGTLLGATALGYYNLAFRLVMEPGHRITPIINNVTFPIYSRIQNNTTRLRRWLFRTIRLVSLVNAPLVLGLAAVAPVFVPALFGEVWQPTVLLVQILAIVGLLRSTGSPVGSLLMAKGRTDLSFRWNASLVLTQIPGVFLGARVGGVAGVAAAMAILQILYATLGAYLALVRPMVGRCGREYAMSRLPVFAVAGGMATVVLGVQTYLGSSDSVARLVLLTALGVVAYAIMAFIFLRADLIAIRQLIARRPAPGSQAVPR